jgi:hypothetical protein
VVLSVRRSMHRKLKWVCENGRFIPMDPVCGIRQILPPQPWILLLCVRGPWVIMTKEPCVWTVSEVSEVSEVKLLQLENTRLLVEVATLRERLAAIGSIVGNY